MPASPDIRTAVPGEEEALATAVALAFDEDPVMRFIWPEPAARRENFQAMALPYAGLAVACGTAQVIGDFAAVALWLPPGRDIDGAAATTLLQRTLSPALLPAYLAQGARVGALHPAGPHWYLPLIGADPARFGMGFGGALLAHGLAMPDRAGLPVFLESTNPANLGLYRRHGFQLVEEVPGGGGPPKFALLRDVAG